MLQNGNGKTFTIADIQAKLEFGGQKAIAVATCAVATSLLGEGRAAHSVFKIPIPSSEHSICSTSMGSKLADTTRRSHLIIWDEIVVCAIY